MTTMSHSLSEEEIAAITRPGLHRVAPRLYISISGHGHRFWRYRYQVRGQMRTIGIGECARVSYAEAQRRVEVLRRRADPAALLAEERERLREAFFAGTAPSVEGRF